MSFYAPRNGPFFAALLCASIVIIYFESILEIWARHVNVSTLLINEHDDRTYVQKQLLHIDEKLTESREKVIYIGGSSMRETTDDPQVIDGVLHFSLATVGQDLAESTVLLNNLDIDQRTAVLIGLTPVSLTYSLRRSLQLFTTRSYPFLDYGSVQDFFADAKLAEAGSRKRQSAYSWFGKFVYHKVTEEGKVCLSRIRPACLWELITEKPIIVDVEYERHRFHVQFSEEGMQRQLKKLSKRIEERKGPTLDKNLEMLGRLVASLSDRGARVVLVALPVEPRIRPWVMMHVHEKFDSYLSALVSDRVAYHDMTNDPNLAGGAFRDMIHVNRSGYEILNPALRVLVNTSFVH